MSSYEHWCVKIGVVFHALYFENEVGDPPPPFFCISDKGNPLSDCSQSMTKICVVETFSVNVLKFPINVFPVTVSESLFSRHRSPDFFEYTKREMKRNFPLACTVIWGQLSTYGHITITICGVLVTKHHFCVTFTTHHPTLLVIISRH